MVRVSAVAGRACQRPDVFPRRGVAVGDAHSIDIGTVDFICRIFCRVEPRLRSVLVGYQSTAHSTVVDGISWEYNRTAATARVVSTAHPLVSRADLPETCWTGLKRVIHVDVCDHHQARECIWSGDASDTLDQDLFALSVSVSHPSIPGQHVWANRCYLVTRQGRVGVRSWTCEESVVLKSL